MGPDRSQASSPGQKGAFSWVTSGDEAVEPGGATWNHPIGALSLARSSPLAGVPPSPVVRRKDPRHPFVVSSSFRLPSERCSSTQDARPGESAQRPPRLPTSWSTSLCDRAQSGPLSLRMPPKAHPRFLLTAHSLAGLANLAVGKLVPNTFSSETH